ncbi:4Fe-4S binding protein [Desulfocicer niacini]
MVAPVSLGIALATLSVAGWLSARHGRLYCNILCPLGALLGLVASVSLLRIGIDKDTCKTCRLCETVCKAGCIDIKSMAVDTSRCVACCNYLPQWCPPPPFQNRKATHPGRRGKVH